MCALAQVVPGGGLRPSKGFTPLRDGLTNGGGCIDPFLRWGLRDPVLEALCGNRTAACVLLFL